MKGLLLNNFLNIKPYLPTLIVLSLLLFGVNFLLFFGNFGSLYEYVYMPITILLFLIYPLVTIVCYERNSSVDWSKLELTMPVSKATIVSSKYFSYVASMVISCFWVLLFTFINNAIGGVGIQSELISLKLVFLGLMLGAGALFYPIITLMGIEKLETAITLILVTSVIPLRVAMEIGSHILQLNRIFDIYRYPEFSVSYVLLMVVLLCLSYITTIKIYNKKEFI